MTHFIRFHRRSAVQRSLRGLGVLVFIPLVLWGQDGKAPEAKPAGASASGPGNDPLMQGNAMEGAFDLFPVGKPWKEVRVPRYNDRDELASMMHSVTLTREADRLLELDGLTLVTFESTGKLSLRLKTARGYYGMDTGQLRSRTKTYIEHPQFDMQGDSMIFDTKTGKGTLNGNVEMVIYDMAVAAMPLPMSSSGK